MFALTSKKGLNGDIYYVVSQNMMLLKECLGKIVTLLSSLLHVLSGH